MQVTYLHAQNQQDLGSQYSLNPFITFNRPFGKKHSLDFKLNLGKPYFTHFYDEYEPRSKFDKTMKVLFSTRVGVNLYAINTAKITKHNVSVGAFLNANYGQADYNSIILKYSIRLN
jgi:hypothetical protein